MKSILNNWNLMRLIRLVLGIIIIVQGIFTNQIMFALIGGLFTIMALFNIGCCSSACNINISNKQKNTAKEINYEEVV